MTEDTLLGYYSSKIFKSAATSKYSSFQQVVSSNGLQDCANHQIMSLEDFQKISIGHIISAKDCKSYTVLA